MMCARIEHIIRAWIGWVSPAAQLPKISTTRPASTQYGANK